MLGMLEKMVSDSEEPYNGLVWQLVCSPFTPFLILFREILSKTNDAASIAHKRKCVESMEHVPDFLTKMSLRNSLAAKLKGTAVVFVQHARSLLESQGA